ncbi:MAG: PAS domain S-box protein [Deltaproteobacteria bacterium]|nr:PAS domain S-box protein [Deltaproteobacteria bacterium]MBW2129655.1 PAS domain S-box protein [Deltaproteobacteria bacterium]MBW2303070.1 PAS domain S-box protein [Deltaproteobacteria bacterium]
MDEIAPFISKEYDGRLNIGIAGGGKACLDLLRLLNPEHGRLQNLRMRILGVYDRDSKAPGVVYARALNLPTTTDLREFLALRGLNLIIELTGSEECLLDIHKNRPSGVSVIDGRAAQLVRELVRIETEQWELERRRNLYQGREQKQVQEILDSLPYRIMVVGMDKRIHAVNRTFLKEFGYSRREVIGRYCYDVRYGLNRPCQEEGKTCFLEERLSEIREKGLFSTYKERVDEKGDTRFDVVTIAPIYDDAGNIVQILEVSRDVTERMKLEREVRRAKTFFEMVIQSSVDGIVVVDTKGKVLIFNEGMERLTGYSAEEIINKGHLSNFYDIDIARENMKKMRSDQYGPPGKLNPTSMTVTSKTGERIPVTLSASIISIDGKEIGSVGIFTDMREVLKMRKELEEANLQLFQSQKIASVGRMAAGVAHEINNPLSAILIYTELLKEVVKDDPQHKADLQEIIDQTMRCKKIVSELLEFSRKPSGKTTAFSLEDIITKCLSLLTSKASFHDISVTTDIEKDMPQLTGDADQIQQVFTNLFINAADAMQGKGRLDITARFEHNRNMFVVEVSDTGPGIPEKYRDKVFDIFFSSKPVGKGTGLGLSISQNIIKLHGGSLYFKCPPGGGTTFFVELPLEYSAPPSEEEEIFIGLDESHE